MLLRIRSYLNIFWLLIRTDLTVFKQFAIGQLINTLAWSGSMILVSTYIYPKLGMTDKFGEFIAVSCIIANSFWGVWDSAYKILEDIEGEKMIDYSLILPIPSWLVVVQQAIKHFIMKFFPSLIVLPVFKIVLGNRMDLSNFSTVKFLFMLVTINMFTGFFFLFVSSFIKNSYRVENVGIRLLFPMWFFGAADYSWQVIYSINSKIGYLHLINPLVYAMEGIHSAVSGASGYLPFWLCAIALWAWILMCGWVSVARFKKRLDFV